MNYQKEFFGIFYHTYWNDLMTKNNAADMFSSFDDVIVEAYDAAFPVVQ